LKQIYVAHCFKKAYIHFMEYVADHLDNPQKDIIECVFRTKSATFSEQAGRPFGAK
jgi:hypothetical protein